ncbi:hypothetical protein SAMN05444278_102151 [Psychroflexus salarius]|uniref:Uncharacterized protein n=1 Tax=Psychroflexus salarius TaxID=1155689 RepID=A0A1M4U2J3_9FLAO|nr:hypothetical protein [Psychroflexus salarius]SHE50850.1 hypothetical protein SAMN05444278_102151 [Psychroflexus salarius]
MKTITFILALGATMLVPNTNNLNSDDYRKASCSVTIGNVTFTHTVGCFLCGEDRAERRCQRKLNELVALVTENPDCECL